MPYFFFLSSAHTAFASSSIGKSSAISNAVLIISIISTIGLASLPSIGISIGIAMPSSAGLHSLSLFLMYQPLMLIYLTPSLATNSTTTLVLFDFLTSPILLQLFHINFLLILIIAPFQSII